MKNDGVVGHTVRFTFDDGAMAGKTFEHAFAADGTVTFRQLGVDAKPAPAPRDAPSTKYEVQAIRGDVLAVSYRSSAGYTLTAVLDFETHQLVAFASNEKMHTMQHGRFEVAAPTEGKR